MPLTFTRDQRNEEHYDLLVRTVAFTEKPLFEKRNPHFTLAGSLPSMLDGIARCSARNVEYVVGQLPTQLAKSCGGGTLVLIGRFISELKFLLVLVFSSVIATATGRKSADAVHCDRETAAACAHLDTSSICIDKLVCIAEKKAALEPTLGWRLSDHVEQVCLVFLVLLVFLNLYFVVNRLTVVLADDEFWKDWREHNYADVVMCFYINRSYATPFAARVRRFNATFVLLALGYSFSIAMFRGTLHVLLTPDKLYVDLGLIYSAYNLWVPEERLATIQWGTFYKQPDGSVRIEDVRFFEWGDLLSGAPTVLLQKLTYHACKEEYQEIREQEEVSA